VSKVDRKNGVPSTLTTIPLADPHAGPAEPSIGHLIKDATTQVSTLVRAEVELARAEITRDVKKGLTGSVFFIAALVVLFYSTFFFFFFVAELLGNWLPQWAAYLFVKVRRIRGPRQTIESVKETRTALTPGHDKAGARAITSTESKPETAPTDPSGW